MIAHMSMSMMEIEAKHKELTGEIFPIGDNRDWYAFNDQSKLYSDFIFF